MNSSPESLASIRSSRAPSSVGSSPIVSDADSTGSPVRLTAVPRATVGADGRDARLHLFALDDHRLEVRADAAALEPRRAPQRHCERVELAEVRRTLDGRTGQAELVRGRVVVHAGVAVVLLIREHLARRTERADERVAVAGDRCVERVGHGSVHLEATGRAVLQPVRRGWRSTAAGWSSTVGLQPQPLQVADVAAGAVVLVRGAAVQHVVVVDELHVAGLQLHRRRGCRGSSAIATTARSASRCSVGEARRVGVALRRAGCTAGCSARTAGRPTR